ncbi:hypothetical protein AB4089_08280 [Arthrobacter sp. 2MCAF15]|uniref:hypothetical protein n=1 Tax=Arthrobacter sp. 2MCAF15 TaxID=3232984 RepID=UPI003F918145
MSMDLSSRPETSREYAPISPSVSNQGDGDARLRLQAAEIIAAVLSDSTPGHAAAREQLWQCLQAHPDRPEIALVEHLIALREEAGGGTPGLHSVRRPIVHQRPTLRVRYGRPDRGGRGGLGGLAADGA